MSEYENLRLTIVACIDTEKSKRKGKIEDRDIENCVDRAIQFLNLTESNIDRSVLIAEMQRAHKTWMGRAQSLAAENDGNWVKWLEKSRSDIDWRYWVRYRAFLLQKGWPKTIVDVIDEVTDETLSFLNNPQQKGIWDRRGMVVGHVQSGKTANYIGLIGKAADAGYKVIIILAGFHNSLRTQTQIRLEEGFIGYDKYAGGNEGVFEAVGVGNIDRDPTLRPDTITTRADGGDFKRNVARNFGKHLGDRPLLFVVKKHSTVLQNLIGYLEWAHTTEDEEGNPLISDIPLLLIDDEADQGSVDTKKMDEIDGELDPEHDPTKINGHIRKILNIFTQSSYVGYTATPFANIFIHSQAKSREFGDDLFPRSFITVMPEPSNYIGPDKVFGLYDNEESDHRGGLPITRFIKDYAKTMNLRENEGWMPPKHDTNHLPLFRGESKIPDTLKEAVLVFIIGCAVRIIRGQGGEHTSMLVHVTRLNNVQKRVTEQVKSYLKDIQNNLRYGMDTDAELFRGHMKELWENDFKPTTKEINQDGCPVHEWSEIEDQLNTALLSVEIREINGRAGDVLDYDRHRSSGLNVIAVGGDKLSRGLTLEGLTVSYFTRPSRMYDTLMQMGRWFGYRPGYLDVCRLYAPKSLIEWFGHIADASEELRQEFKLMYEKGDTPLIYGQRVQSHPVLLVTSQVKMRNTVELTLSYSGAISETIVYSRKDEDIDNNFNATEKLISEISSYAVLSRSPVREKIEKVSEGKYHWQSVKTDDILSFLKNYQTAAHVRRVNTGLLSAYIEKQQETGNLIEWSVLLAGKKSDIDTHICDCKTGLITRSNHPKIKDIEIPAIYRIRRLVSPSDEAWDLNEEQYEEALRLTRMDYEKKESTSPSGPELRSQRDKTALLILYPLEYQEMTGPEKGDTNKPYIGFAISFPGIKEDTPIIYRVNDVYQEMIND